MPVATTPTITNLPSPGIVADRSAERGSADLVGMANA